MAIRRTAHAVYDTKYHLVWTPKYRKWIKRSDIRERGGEKFLEIAQHHGFEIQEMRHLAGKNGTFSEGNPELEI